MAPARLRGRQRAATSKRDRLSEEDPGGRRDKLARSIGDLDKVPSAKLKELLESRMNRLIPDPNAKDSQEAGQDGCCHFVSGIGEQAGDPHADYVAILTT